MTLPAAAPNANITALAVDIGAGETDNILRTESNGKSQTFALVGTDFELKRATQRLDADLKGDLNYIDYVQGAFATQLLGRVDGTAGWQLWPEHLRWVLQDDFGESQLDPFTAVTPANLEHINIVSTGPDLILRPSQNVFVKLAAHDSYAQYQTSPFDNNRILANASIGHDLSIASNVSVNADFQTIRFTNTVVNTNFDRRNFYLAYAARGARTELGVDVGISQANIEGPWNTTPFIRVQMTRTLSAASTLELSVGRQYSDATDAFRGLQGGAIQRIAVAPATGSTSSYLDQYASAIWRFARIRTNIDISASWERDTYAIPTAADLNVNRQTFEARFSRRLTSALTGDISGHFARERFFQVGVGDNDYLGSIGITFQPARRLDLRLHYDHEVRTADIRSANYHENRVLATLGYRLLP